LNPHICDGWFCVAPDRDKPTFDRIHRPARRPTAVPQAFTVATIAHMHLTVNGESRQLPQDATVRSLVEDLGLGQKPVAVEVNKQLVPHRQHQLTRLTEGDQVEIVTLVGGG